MTDDVLKHGQCAIVIEPNNILYRETRTPDLTVTVTVVIPMMAADLTLQNVADAMYNIAAKQFELEPSAIKPQEDKDGD